MLNPDANVLGRILAAQNVLFVLPSSQSIAEFYASALASLPGVRWSRVCLGDASAREGPFTSQVCAGCPEPAASAGAKVGCRLASAAQACVVAAETIEKRYGYFVVGFDQIGTFDPYRGFVGNLAGFVALHLENREKSALLRQSHDELEQRVSERTEQLRKVNQQLTAEIDERRRAQEALSRGNRELRAISDCNQMLLRAVDESSLLESVCRVICDEAGYRLAAVAFADMTAPGAAHIFARENCEPIADFSWTEPAAGGPAAEVLRSGEVVCHQNLEIESDSTAWRKAALQVGCRSCISLPLLDDANAPFGVLSIYSEEQGIFTPPEVRLLSELAGDLAFGIRGLRHRHQQRLAEEARRLAEDRLRKLSRAVEQSPVSIIITDTSGQIEYVNPKFTEVTGYTLAEVQGQNPRLLKSGHTSVQEYAKLWQTITSGREWRGEFRNRRKNGELFWEFASISPIFEEGARTITHFVAVKEDITERRLLEEELRQTQKLEAVGRLAGGVAHDFNNILASMVMVISALREEPDLSPEVRDGLDDLRYETERAVAVTRQLLLFSRRQTADLKPLDLNWVIANMAKMLRRLIGEDIDLVIQACDSDLWIKADAGMTEQILLNLCVNARDAMPRGGPVTISTGRIVIDAEQALLHGVAAGVFVCLSVKDTGCGMDKAILQRIFEPFFTTKDVGKGTGLGLATVYGIVKQHQGWIEVESTPGRGSCFRIFLPELAAAVEELAANPAAPMNGGGEVILVVEDDRSLQRQISSRLRKLGYEVLEAASGIEALALWSTQSRSVDLVLTDMVMPGGMSGLDLVEQLGAWNPQLRAIIASGYEPERTRLEQLAALGIEFLQKPYDPVVLAQAVRACLDR